VVHKKNKIIVMDVFTVTEPDLSLQIQAMFCFLISLKSVTAYFLCVHLTRNSLYSCKFASDSYSVILPDIPNKF
jgi:hypothetical protein